MTGVVRGSKWGLCSNQRGSVRLQTPELNGHVDTASLEPVIVRGLRPGQESDTSLALTLIALRWRGQLIGPNLRKNIFGAALSTTKASCMHHCILPSRTKLCLLRDQSLDIQG
jgi:hypothetical protein